MTAKRDLHMDILFNTIVMAIVYGFFAAPALILTNIGIQNLLLFIIGGFVYLFLIRRVIKPAVPMFLAHMIIPLAAWFFSSGVIDSIAYMIVAAYLILFSLYQRYKRTKTFSSEFIFAISIALIILTFVAVHFGFTFMIGSYAGIIVFFCVGTRLHMRMYQVSTSLEVITQNSGQHIQNILTHDYKTMFILGVVLVSTILMLGLLVITPILRLIPRINFEQVDIPPDEIEIEMFDAVFSPANEIELLREHNEDTGGPFLIWRVLEWLILYIAMPALGLFILYLMLTKIRKIFKIWKYKAGFDPNLNNEIADIKEFIRKPKVKNRWLGRGKEHKLRKLYRETITRHIKKGVPIIKTDTPDEIKLKIITNDITTLTEDYASVRYT